MKKMKRNAFIAGLFISAAAASVSAQPAGNVTKYIMVDGDVIRYDPGHAIVIRGTDNREVTYNLAPGLAMPSDVRVGRRVTLYTEPATNGGTQLVQRVTTTTVTPEGNVKR